MVRVIFWTIVLIIWAGLKHDMLNWFEGVRSLSVGTVSGLRKNNRTKSRTVCILALFVPDFFFIVVMFLCRVRDHVLYFTFQEKLWLYFVKKGNLKRCLIFHSCVRRRKDQRSGKHHEVSFYSVKRNQFVMCSPDIRSSGFQTLINIISQLLWKSSASSVRLLKDTKLTKQANVRSDVYRLTQCPLT